MLYSELDFNNIITLQRQPYDILLVARMQYRAVLLNTANRHFRKHTDTYQFHECHRERSMLYV